MARYSAFLDRRVEVRYRAGEIPLSATATLVADSGRSIFLEEQIEQRGQPRYFRWEIPYQCIVRIVEKPGGCEPRPSPPHPDKRPAPRAAAFSGKVAPFFPTRPRPEMA